MQQPALQLKIFEEENTNIHIIQAVVQQLSDQQLKNKTRYLEHMIQLSQFPQIFTYEHHIIAFLLSLQIAQGYPAIKDKSVLLFKGLQLKLVVDLIKYQEQINKINNCDIFSEYNRKLCRLLQFQAQNNLNNMFSPYEVDLQSTTYQVLQLYLNKSIFDVNFTEIETFLILRKSILGSYNTTLLTDANVISTFEIVSLIKDETIRKNICSFFNDNIIKQKTSISFENLTKLANKDSQIEVRTLLIVMINQKFHVFQMFKVLFLFFSNLLLHKQQSKFIDAFYELTSVSAFRFIQFLLIPLFICCSEFVDLEDSKVEGFLYPCFLVPDLFESVQISNKRRVYRDKLATLLSELKVDQSSIYETVIKEFQSNMTTIYKFPLIYFQFYKFLLTNKMERKPMLQLIKQLKNFFISCHFEKQDRQLLFQPHLKYVQLIERPDLTEQMIINSGLFFQIDENIKLDLSDQFNLTLYQQLLQSPIQQVPTIYEFEQQQKQMDQLTVIERVKSGLYFDVNQLSQSQEYSQLSFYDLSINDFIQGNSQTLPYIILAECLCSAKDRKLFSLLNNIAVDTQLFQLYNYYEAGLVLPQQFSFDNKILQDLQLRINYHQVGEKDKQIIMIEEYLQQNTLINQNNVTQVIFSLRQFMKEKILNYDQYEQSYKSILQVIKQFACSLDSQCQIVLKWCLIFVLKSLNFQDFSEIVILFDVCNQFKPESKNYIHLWNIAKSQIEASIVILVNIIQFSVVFNYYNKTIRNIVIAYLVDTQCQVFSGFENVVINYLLHFSSTVVEKEQLQMFFSNLTKLQTNFYCNQQIATVYHIANCGELLDKIQQIVHVINSSLDEKDLIDCFKILRNEKVSVDKLSPLNKVLVCGVSAYLSFEIIELVAIEPFIKGIDKYSVELIDFTISHNMVHILDPKFLKIKMYEKSKDVVFNLDLNFDFQKSMKLTTSNNDLRLALMGMRQQCERSSVLWRLDIKQSNVQINSVQADNVFDDFMQSQKPTDYDTLIEILLKNLKNSLYLTMTICMFVAATKVLLHDALYLDRECSILEKFVSFFEFELIESSKAKLSKQLCTSLQKIQQFVNGSQKEMELIKLIDTVLLFREYEAKQQSIQQSFSIDQDANNQLNIVKRLPEEYLDEQKKIQIISTQFQDLIQSNGFQLKDIFIKLISTVSNRFVFAQVLDLQVNQACIKNNPLFKDIVIYQLLMFKAPELANQFINFKFIQLIVQSFSEDNEFLTILNFVSQKNSNIVCSRLEQQLDDQYILTKQFVQTIIDIMKGQQLPVTSQQIYLQHPLKRNIIISAIEISKVAHSNNLVIFAKLSTSQGEFYNVMKIGSENFSSSYAFELLINLMNENLHQEPGPASSCEILKLHVTPFLTVTSRNKDQKSLFRDIQAVMMQHGKQVLDDISIGFSDFQPILSLQKVVEQHPSYKKYNGCIYQIYLKQQSNDKQFCFDQKMLLMEEFPKDIFYKFLVKKRMIGKDVTFHHFTQSFIINSAMLLIFGYGDRHLENIVLQDDQIMHIDPEKLYFQSLLQASPEIVRFRYTNNFQYIFPKEFFPSHVIRVQKQMFCNNRNVIQFILQNQVQNDFLRHFIEMKFDLTEGEWQREVQEATDPQKLAHMFIGWMPFI